MSCQGSLNHGIVIVEGDSLDKGNQEEQKLMHVNDNNGPHQPYCYITSTDFHKTNEVTRIGIFEKLQSNLHIETCRKTLSKYRQSIITISVIVILAFALFAGIVFYTRSSNTPEEESPDSSDSDQEIGENDIDPENPEKMKGARKHPSFYSGGHYRLPQVSVVVDSRFKLRSISEVTVNVTVQKLITQSKPAGISIAGGEAVKKLVLIGQITREWLHYILKTLKGIETLEINVDTIGAGLKEFGDDTNVNSKALAPVTLPELRTIIVENSHKYPILKWGFELEIPQLKVVQVSKATFFRPFFDIFASMLNNSKSSIEGIEISQSCICSDCDITRLQFESLQYMKITKRVEEDIPKDKNKVPEPEEESKESKEVELE